MSEGPEVKITADKIWNALSGKRIANILHNKIDSSLEDKIIRSSTEYVKTFGKNIVIKFSSGVYLRNHMMMWENGEFTKEMNMKVGLQNHHLVFPIEK